MHLLVETVFFYFFIHLAQAIVYVLNNGIFSDIVDSFDDAVSQFGPELFHVDGFLLEVSPRNACSKLQPVHNRTHFKISSASGFTTDVSNLPFIALIERGDCYFDTKVFNAQLAGFSAVIVYNDVDHVIFPMKGHTVADKVVIPSVMVDKAAGEQLSLYTCSSNDKKFIISIISSYSLPLKYVLLSLLVLVGISLLVLIGCFTAHMCNLLHRIRHGRLSKRHLRRLATKRFIKGEDPHETCPICLEDYKDHEKLRILPCHHAFHIECIDPWLLRNRRRCPVCNRTVDIPGAPRSFSEEEVRQPSSDSVNLPSSSYGHQFRRWVFTFRSRIFNRRRSLRRTSSTESTNTLFNERNEESAPFLSHVETPNSNATIPDDTIVCCGSNAPMSSSSPSSHCATFRPVSHEDDQLLDLSSENNDSAIEPSNIATNEMGEALLHTSSYPASHTQRVTDVAYLSDTELLENSETPV